MSCFIIYMNDRTQKELFADLQTINNTLFRLLPKSPVLSCKYNINIFSLISPMPIMTVPHTKIWTPSVFSPYCRKEYNLASAAIHRFAINSRTAAETHLLWVIIGQLYILFIRDEEAVRHYNKSSPPPDCDNLRVRLRQLYDELSADIPFLRLWHRLTISARVIDEHLITYVGEDEFIAFMSQVWPVMNFTMLALVLVHDNNAPKLKTVLVTLKDDIERILCILSHNYHILVQNQTYREILQGLQSSYTHVLPDDLDYTGFTDYNPTCM